jgi:hypothetical protein
MQNRVLRLIFKVLGKNIKKSRPKMNIFSSTGFVFWYILTPDGLR